MRGLRCCSALFVAALSLGLLLLPGATSVAQDPLPATAAATPPSATAPPAGLRFRRVYVPEDRIDELATDTIPLRRERFEEMVNAFTSAPAAVHQSGIDSCLLAARLSPTGELSGLGQISIRQGNDSNRYVSLAPCRLPITSAWWGEEFDELLLGCDPQGRLGAMIDRNGLVHFQWHAVRNPQESAGPGYHLTFPTSPLNKLLVLAPAGVELSSSAGMLQQADAAELGEWSWAGESFGTDETAWLLELGGLTQATLTLEPTGIAGPVAQQPGYRQTTRYELSHHETEVITDIYLDRPLTPLAQLAVRWPAELSLVSALWEKQPLSWEERAWKEDPRQRAATLALPPGAAGGGVPISLRFRGVPLAGEAQPLPRVSVTNAYWREGEVRLTVLEPLVLTQVNLTKSVLLTERPGGEANKGQHLAVRLMAEEGEIRVATQLRQAMVYAAAATLLDFDSEGIRARYIANLTSAQAAVFELKAELGSGWTVDAVEVAGAPAAKETSSEVLRDWNVVATGGPTQTLEVRLNKPLSPQQNVQLLVTAHQRNTALEGTLLLRDLNFLTLQGIPLRRQFFAWRADAALQLQLESPGTATLIDAAQLPAPLDAWYLKQSAGLTYAGIWEAAGNVPHALLSLQRAKPRYTCSLESRWLVGAELLRASHRMSCVPQSGAIGRLLVRVGSKQPKPLDWSIEHDPNVSITPRLLHEDLEGVIWEIGIYPPQANAFTLLAQRQLARAEVNRLGLLSLPEAMSQTGTVEVEAATAKVQYRLLPRGLTIAPVVAAEHRRTLFSRFRYQAGESRRLELVADKTTIPPTLLQVWSFELDSLVTSERVRHTAQYFIENRGEAQFPVTLPAGVEFQGLQVDGVPVKTTGSDLGNPVPVALPAGKRFVTVRLDYDEPPLQAWRLWRRVEAKLPHTPWPALQATWRLQASPELALWNGKGLTRLNQATPWYAKLFGSLAGGTSSSHGAEPASGAAVQASPETPLTKASPWLAAGAEALLHDRDMNWPRLELPLGEGAPLHVTLTKPMGWQILSIGLLLISAAGTLLACRRRVRLIVPILGVTGTLCLLAPSMCAVATSGLFLGALLAAVWLAVAALGTETPAHAETANRQEASTTTAAKFSTLIGWFVISVTLTAAVATWGESQLRAQEAPAKRSPIYPVFIPMNTKEESQGNYVHVPEAFYKALHRRYSDHRSPEVGWLLHSAEYVCRLETTDAPLGSASGVEAAELRFEGEITILRGDTPLLLPFRADQLTLLQDSAFLGGNPIEPSWTDDGQALMIPPQSPGQMRLELTFRPKVTSSSGRTVMKLNVPPAVHAHLELLHPTDVSGFGLHPSVPLREISEQRTTASLGPVDQWELELPAATARDQSLAAEQMAWVHLKPGSTVWDVHCRYTPTAGSTSLVEWEVDPNLRLLTLSVEGAEYARHSRFTQRRLMQIQLMEPVSEPFTVQAKFIQEESHGIGRLKLPLLRAVGAQQDRRWLAVSADDSLSLSFEHDETVQPLTPTEFLSAWGEEPQPPARAFRLLLAEPYWSVAATVVPRPAMAQTYTTLSLAGNRTELEYELRAPAGESAAALYQFKLPPNFRVEEAQLHVGEVTQTLLPAVQKNHMLVLLPQPVALAHRLTFHLSGPAAEPTYQLPVVAVENVVVTEAEYRVYRQADVQVTFPSVAPEASPPIPSELAPQASSWGRLAALFVQSAEESALPWPQATVVPNQPRVEKGELVMALDRREGNWLLNLTVRGDVTGGTLDTLRLNAPERLALPTVHSPTATLLSQRLPGESRTQWVIQPNEPLRGTFVVELAVPLEFEPGIAPRLPTIELAGSQPLTTFVLLPQLVNGQHAAWTLTNLEPVEPPAMIGERPWLPMEYNAFRAGEDFAASLSLESPRRLEPQVRLADINLVVDSSRRYFGTAAFDLEPGGLSTCRLQLPAELSLEQVRLDGAAIVVRAARGTNTSPGMYECLLGEANLPHRLEVLFSGRASGEDLLQLPVPRLPEVPVERTLWTIAAPRGMALPARDTAIRPLDQQRHLGFRLQAVASLAEPPSHLLAAVSKRDLAPWYRNWAQRMARYFQAGQALTQESGEEVYPFDDDFLREHSEMAARMGLSMEFEAVFGEQAVDRPEESHWQLSEIVADSYPPLPGVIHAMSQGAPSPLKLEVLVDEPAAWSQGWGALLLLLGSFAGYFWLRKRSLSQWTVWWLHPTAVLVGILWWLYFTPAAVGWVIIGITLLGSLRSPWRMQTLNQRRGLVVR